MAENVPNLGGGVGGSQKCKSRFNDQSKPQRTYTKTHHKLVYTKDKENIMKEAGVKLYITYRKKTIQMTVYFSEKKPQRSEGRDINL